MLLSVCRSGYFFARRAGLVRLLISLCLANHWTVLLSSSGGFLLPRSSGFMLPCIDGFPLLHQGRFVANRLDFINLC